MSSLVRVSITQCYPAWRNHKWEIVKTRDGRAVKVRCVHCEQIQTGCRACDWLICRDGVVPDSKLEGETSPPRYRRIAIVHRWGGNWSLSVLDADGTWRQWRDSLSIWTQADLDRLKLRLEITRDKKLDGWHTGMHPSCVQSRHAEHIKMSRRVRATSVSPCSTSGGES